MRIKLTALALAAILPLASAQAAGNGKSSYTKWQKNDQHWMQELGLDDKQRLQFQEKRNAYRAEQHKQRQEMNRQRKQRSDTYRREMQARHERHHNELRNLLNPEQRMAFDRYQQAMKAAGKQKFAVREYTRCQVCGRPHSVYRKFGLCRICFRNMAHAGQLPGITKSSW